MFIRLFFSIAQSHILIAVNYSEMISHIIVYNKNNATLFMLTAVTLRDTYLEESYSTLLIKAVQYKQGGLYSTCSDSLTYHAL